MYYYEFWYYVKNLSDYIKNKNKQQGEQQEQQDKQMSSMRSAYKTPKMPKTPKISSPSIKMPKF